jgi:large-conductance mechanosensitive channel
VCNNLPKGKRIMDQTVKTFTSEGTDTRRWIGRVLIAVILGEAIWGLIVSVMNNLIVPWLGDVMGQSAGLPTSFTQRPYNYPDLFVSLFEFCIAGLVAAVLNYFFQRANAKRVKPARSTVLTPPVEPARVVTEAAATAGRFPAVLTLATSPVAPPAPVAKPDPVIPVVPVPVAPAPIVAPVPVAISSIAASPAPIVANSAAKPLPPAPKAEPPRPKKPKEVYYNSVGEPVPSDED